MYSYHKTAYRFPSPVSLVPYLKQVEGQKASLFHIPFVVINVDIATCFLCKQIVRIISQLIWKLFTSRRNSCLHSLPDWHLIVSPLEEAHRCSSLFLNWNTYWIQLPYSECILHIPLLPVETSPEYADPARLNLLKQAGVARVSIGVQSFLDEELTALKKTSPARHD